MWTPDGSRVAFGSTLEGASAIQWTLADGSGAAETLLTSDSPIVPAAWSPDGKALVYREDSPEPHLFLARIDENEVGTALFETAFVQHSASVSPDGKWLAYVSDRSGSLEVYVWAMNGSAGEHQVSSGGGWEPVWSVDGTELFYRGPNSEVMVASLQAEPFRIVSSELVMEATRFWSGAAARAGRAHYDIDPQGDRFLMLDMRATDRPQINSNW